MNYGGRALASLAVVSALLAASCGGRPSVASRSAAAYDDAKEKGVAIGGGHEHGGHAASATASNGEPAQMPGMDHSKMSDGQMSGMDHSKMPGGQMSGMDHSKMSSGPMSGMDHSKISSGQMSETDHAKMPSGQMSGMDHSKMSSGQMSGMDHSKMQHGNAAAPAAAASLSTTAASRLNPSAILTPDAFDSPAPTSVAEAIKAANNVPDGDIRHVVPGHDRENPPTPQPAIRDGSTERGGEGQQPQTVPPATGSATTGHAGHGGGTAAARPAVHACPMHPEVTSAEPGTCPKCGMALVEKK